MSLLEIRAAGIWCAAGDFYLDPWAPVDRAIITHAHSDRARPGSRAYLTVREGERLLRAQVGPDAAIQTVEYAEVLSLGAARVSLHPAGHLPGSAQVRIEHGGEVWVFSGDYQLAPDATCTPFEPVRCHTFVTEATFALPVFHWPEAAETIAAIEAWWRANQEAGRLSVLYAEAPGPAQRVLAALDRCIGPIGAHPGIEQFNRIYRGQGIELGRLADHPTLLIAPPGTARAANASTAMVSGWMRIRGTRRRRALDRGFVLSGHADWPALLRAIDETGAATVWATHRHGAALARWLEENGRRAAALETRFGEGEA